MAVDEARVAELKKALGGKVTELKEFAAKGIIVDGDKVEVKSEDWAKAKKVYNDANEIGLAIKMAQFGLDDADVKKLSPEEKSLALAAVAGGQMGGAVNGLQRKSLGRAFIESDDFKEFKTSGRLTMGQPYEVQQYDITSGWGQKDVYTALGGSQTIPTLGTVQFDPAVPRAFRPNRVRDLFPVATTSANLIDYFRVTGFTEGGLDGGHSGNAQTVPERDGTQFGLKPHSNLNFAPAQAPVRTIAHWEAAHRNIIADEPQLQSTINNELLYGLALVEDDQILNGDGAGENLLGILNTPGVQQYTAVSGEIGSDSLRRASTLAVLANYPPNGYVLHPNDWETIELQKGQVGSSAGDGQYMLVTNVAIGAQAQVWRQSVVETPAIDEGTFLNGAFGTGVQLYDRQQANIRVAEQHADFFVRNAVVILAEERLALAVKRPESLVKGKFAA